MKLSERIRKSMDDAEEGLAISWPIDQWADEVEQLEAENKRIIDRANKAMSRAVVAEAALTLIGDIAFDSDGYAGNAEKLGGLVGEIYSYARNPQLAVDALRQRRMN